MSIGVKRQLAVVIAHREGWNENIERKIKKKKLRAKYSKPFGIGHMSI
jgi:hypothetical protein